MLPICAKMAARKGHATVHEEWMCPVISVSESVLVDVFGSFGKLVREEIPDLVRVVRASEYAVEEFAIRRKVQIIEIWLAGMVHDQDPALAHQRGLLILAEERC